MAVAPWCLALGLVVSITAEAGQEPPLGASIAEKTSAYPLALPMREALRAPPAPSGFGRRDGDGGYDGDAGLVLEASLTLGSPDDFTVSDDEIEPKAVLKGPGLPLPKIDRTQKADPFIGLRPGFSARLNRLGGPVGASASQQPSPDDGSLAGDVYGSWPPAPFADPSMRNAEPPIGAEASDEKPAPFSDGATPGVPLDLALNSATPTPTDGVLIIVPARNAPEITLAPKVSTNGRPDYAALIDSKDAARQQRCLAEAIYFEARGEPVDGQAAVAQVVLNRVRSGLFPSNVCGVVYQDRNRPFACQFSFACEGRSLRIEEPAAWATAVRVAQDVVSGANYNPLVGEAVNYHANYVTPYWASALQRVDRIGHHIFYKLRVGRT
jgi:hypothetical protein